jgi:hypothetical protein
MYRKVRNTKLRYLIATIPIALLLIGWAAMTMTTASAQSNAISPITASGSGTIAAKTTNTVTFIPAPASTTASPLYVACNGTSTSPTTTTAPYLMTAYGTATVTGEITSNTPGMDNTTSVNNPCAPSASATYFNQAHAVYTFSSVTVNLPNGQSITGGLTFTDDSQGSAVVLGATTMITGEGFGPVTGTGALTGVTGTLERTIVVIQTGSSVSVSSTYWIQLQIPASLLSTVNVVTTNSAGAAITGYYTTLWQNGTQISSCYSPCSFTVINGQSYQVAVSNYGTESFSHWSDGTTTNLRTVNVPSTSTTISLKAVYSP